MARPVCSVVIVNWNGGEALRRCLKSLEKFEDTGKLQVIVSDNDSSDGSQDMLKLEFPYVELLENGANLGFAAGNNRGFGIVKSELVLIMNPDMEFIETGLEKLIAHMEQNPDVGACGCMVMNPDGSFMKQCRRGYPDPLTAFFKASGLIHLLPGNRRVGKYFYSDLPIDRELDVDALSGSFILTRNAVIKSLGGFREEFFMYVEDVDFCKRMRKAGHRIRYLPVMKIRHHGGACMEKKERRTWFYHYHMTRSHLILYADDRKSKGSGIGYYFVFVFILWRYTILSLLTFNVRFFADMMEFIRIHRGKIKPVRTVNGAVE